ncbi:hypothetical protein M8542_36880 [Amycolatopsis sp. OK19-0408]|uniref:Uncharacterized protein n=1 Tax=Amycolatopsis iheyensis TaxID=2945988 RepID=A0A9X2NJC8_9PSEU|nr:hypothetical protein [Amycolatopsis iheyensis]MCR6488418.1 hypothetical protein [Amycolatopsis iheyensis]
MADGQGYAVDLDSFQRTLTDHVDPAVDHLREGADSLRPIGGLATARFVGKDPEQIYGGFTGQADALQKRIATANDALWDSLRQLSQALWEAYRVYSHTEQTHASRLTSVYED